MPELSLPVILAATALVVLGIVLLAVAIVANKRGQRRRAVRAAEVETLVASQPPGEPLDLSGASTRLVLEALVHMKQSVALRPDQEAAIVAVLAQRGVLRRYRRRLGSRRRQRRIEAAHYLGYVGGHGVERALIGAFAEERDPVVRYRIGVALNQVDPAGSVGLLLDSLPGASPWYAAKISAVLLESGRDLHRLVPTVIDSRDPAVRLLLVRFAGRYPAEDLRDFLLVVIREGDPELAVTAARSMAALYPEELAHGEFVRHPVPDVRGIAIAAWSRLVSRERLDRLLSMLREEAASGDDATTIVVHAISDMLRRQPALVPVVVAVFQSTQDPDYRRYLSEVLSFRIQYFFVKLLGRERDSVRAIVAEILASGHTSETIGFLNRNRSRELENEILAAVRVAMERNPDVTDQMQHYLDPRVLAKLDLEPLAFEKEDKQVALERNKLFYLYVVLTGIVLIFPIVFVGRRFGELSSVGFVEAAKAYVLDYNYFLVIYSAALQVVTLLLVVLAFFGARAQRRRWAVKPRSLLFRGGALPSVSIIAPAYCEEATIVESANSLLAVEYPDVELIIVNDGSSDETLNRLISYFELEKVDRVVVEQLRTKPIRGIYVNPAYPRLVVVDKANGGKADSLNAGINVSRKEYFCGIDADSLLEGDAMLKVAAGCLDTEDELVAAGGNIMPVNGCTVERGALVAIRMPKSSVARFQTIEYFRAFMAGRVGWAQAKSLLIISGAFGLFKRDRVVEIGGYLTESGKYAKDTVGEDMELVVRIKRDMLAAGRPHAINYAYNANCWTEVPEDLTILHRQRDRWQRGLIDIMHFHARILFNPRYKRMGLVAMPYFFIFEMVGPLIEIQGFALVIVAALLGLLTPTITLLLFLTVILLGVLVSMLSLYLVESETSYFTMREIRVLIWYSVLENFGFRQLNSYWRVSGYFSAMRKPKGWGKMVRKGFAGSPAGAPASSSPAA